MLAQCSTGGVQVSWILRLPFVLEIVGKGQTTGEFPLEFLQRKGGWSWTLSGFIVCQVCSDTDHEMGLSLMLFVANFQHISNMVTYKRLLGESAGCSLNWLSSGVPWFAWVLAMPYVLSHRCLRGEVLACVWKDFRSYADKLYGTVVLKNTANYRCSTLTSTPRVRFVIQLAEFMGTCFVPRTLYWFCQEASYIDFQIYLVPQHCHRLLSEFPDSR